MATITRLGFSIFSTYDGKGGREARKDIASVGDVAKGIGKTIAAAGVIAGLFAANWVKDAAKAGVASNALQQRAGRSLEVMLGSTKAASEQMEELRAFGSESPISMSVWIRAQQQMTAFGVEAETVVPLMGAVQDAVIAGGGAAQNIERVIEVLSRMSSSAQITAGDLNALGTEGVNAADLVGLSMGKTGATIREEIKQGSISVQDFYDGFIKGSEISFGGMAEGFRETFDGMLDRLSGVKRRIGEILAAPFVDPTAGGAFVEIGNALADMLNIVEDELRGFGPRMKAAIRPGTDAIVSGLESIGDAMKDGGLARFIERVRDAVPVVLSLGAALGAKGLAGALGGGALGAAFGTASAAAAPFVAGILTLSATSPELRSALMDIVGALLPLVPPLTEMAIVIATSLATGLQVVTPVLQVLAIALGFIADNAKIAVPLVGAVGLAFAGAGVGVIAMTTGVGSLTVAMGLLRTTMVAHPILTIAAVLVAIGSLAQAFRDSEGAAVDWSGTLTTGFAEVEQGVTSLSTVISGPSFEHFARLLNRDIPDGLLSLEPTITGQRKWWQILGSELTLTKDKYELTAEEMATIEQHTRELDEAMASQVESGRSATAVYGEVEEALSAYGLEIEDIIPVEDEFASVTRGINNVLGHLGFELETLLPGQGAFAEAAREQAAAQEEFVEIVGESIAAIQGLMDKERERHDPLFALAKASDNMFDAQEKLNQMIEDGEASAREIDAAQRDAALATMEWLAANEDAADVFEQGLTPAMREMLITAGLAPEIVDSVHDSLLALGEESKETSEAIGDMSRDMSTALGESEIASRLMEAGMSEAFTDTSISMAKMVTDLMASGKTYEEAMREVSRQSNIPIEQIEDAFRELRDTGKAVFEFDIPDSTDKASKSVEKFEHDVDKFLNDVRGNQEKVNVSSDNMGRRTNANNERMTDSTRTLRDRVIDFFKDMTGPKGMLGAETAGLNMVTRLTSAWGFLRTTTSTAFGKIRDSIKKPMNFVVNTVYNKGIVGFWNKVSTAMFGGKNKLSTIKGFAVGGPVRGPGTSTSDSIPARLSNGEHVWTAKEVAAAGGHQAMLAARSAVMNGQPVQGAVGGSSPGLFMGGFIKAAGGILGTDAFGKEMDKLAGGGWQGIFGAASGALSKLLTGLATNVDKIKGDSNSGKFMKMIKSGGSRIVERLTSWMNGAEAASVQGIGGYQAMYSWIKSIVPGTTLNSGLRPGDPGYHGRGQAVDLGFPDRSEYRGGGMAKKAYDAIVGAFQSSTAELIWDYSPMGYGVGLWNGKKHKFNSPSAAPPSHNDHIHWASTNAAGGMGGGKSGSAGGWSNTVTAVLKELGLFSSSHLALVLQAIQKESSGNPRAQNNWDINARNGVPSKGLLQTIDPTFNAYAGPYRARGPFDPYANIFAAVRYAQSRYGSGWAARMARPGGYAEGGAVSYDSGGMLQPGYTLAYNGTGKPEPVGHDLGGDTYIFNIDLNNSVVAKRQDAEELVVQAIEDAVKHKRLKLNSRL